MLSALTPGSLALRTVIPGIRSNLVFNTPTYWSVEIPSAGGIGQATSTGRLARCNFAYGHGLGTRFPQAISRLSLWQQ
jgi:hypothetical protein